MVVRNKVIVATMIRVGHILNIFLKSNRIHLCTDCGVGIREKEKSR